MLGGTGGLPPFVGEVKAWLSQPATDVADAIWKGIANPQLAQMLAVLLVLLGLWMLPNLTQYRVRGQSKKLRSAPLTVVLVHGTWARGPFLRLLSGHPARWVAGDQEGCGQLRKKLQQLFGDSDVQYRYFNWSGRNTTFARRRAEKRLAADLEQIAAVAKGKILVIGHSHGGTVACRALQALTDRARNRIEGVVCLSTPFLHFFYRDVRSPLSRLAISLILLPIALAPLLVARSQVNQGLLLGDVLSVGLALLLLASIFMAARLRTAAQRLADRFTFDHLSPEDVLLVRASGDEASLALIAAQAMAWLSQASLQMIDKMARRLSRVGAKVAVVLGIGVAVWALVHARIDGTPGPAQYAAQGIALAIVVLTVFCLMIALGAAWLSLLALTRVPALGTLAATLSPFLDVAVEAAPMGSWTVHYVKPQSKGSGLDHATYNNKEALDVMAKWLEQKQLLGKWPRSNAA